MNHKRKRPRNRRAGCKMCKPWKINGVAGDDCWRHSEVKRKESADEQIREVREFKCD